MTINSPRTAEPRRPSGRLTAACASLLLLAALLAGCGGAEEKEQEKAAGATSKPAAKSASKSGATGVNPDSTPPPKANAKAAFDPAKLGDAVRKQGVREEKSALSRFTSEAAAGSGGDEGTPRVVSAAEFLNPTDGSAPAKMTKGEVFVQQPEMLVIDYEFVGDNIVDMRAKDEAAMKTLKIRATFQLKNGEWVLGKTSKMK